ncbi:16S rRNA (uracil(1498)-N(3))-methyltransferase [Microvirga splendida]|uniref:Ribosomal RNA small subunit methyltransferase E n=1 Tax=Microvirga splendida TaxID=2795727 RepID=A0ABS0XXE9_9HYPH|nr:16S rRNA (uracil(1498)-N(3))-methyltransferase [Microvirga splendida]MBJ6124398.1 16S rRNA (uracil(1498)-N(3))-methyltransferase [Microvirga splendida]
MAGYDFNAPRLFVDAPLRTGARVELDRGQANYLLNVLRLKSGDSVLIFNGQDGEWRAEVSVEGRKAADLVCMEQVREQAASPDIIYAFAPLKHARLDYMVQKAVEMGAGILQPVLTQRTQSSRVNLDRMRSNAVEAAEQCGILTIPEVREEENLERFLKTLEKDRLVIFCDENAPVANPVEALAKLGNNQAGLVVIVGPEGGFTDQERALVAAHERCVCVSLGPRILRADTAAVAAMAIVQSVLGDWN